MIYFLLLLMILNILVSVMCWQRNEKLGLTINVIAVTLNFITLADKLGG